MKSSEITVTRNEIPRKVGNIFGAFTRTLQRLRAIKREDDLLFQLRFSKMGTRWDDPEQPDDLGEQLRQSMTMLTAYYAIDWFCGQLMSENKPVFTINAEDKNSPDISAEYEHSKLGHRNHMSCKIFVANDPYENDMIFHILNILARRKREYENEDIFRLILIAFCSPIPLNEARRACEREKIVITDFRDRYVCTDISYEFAGEKGFLARIIHVTPRELQQWIEKTGAFHCSRPIAKSVGEARKKVGNCR